MQKRKGSLKPYVGVAALLLAASLQQNAMALEPIKIGDVDVGTITGYARVHASWNLQDHPDVDWTGGPASTKTMEGQGEMSMLRETLQMQYVNANLPYDTKLTVVGRLVKESRTTYLKRLDASQQAFTPGADSFMDHYNSNRESIREAYLDIPLSKNVNLRFGKQQVVWGETDLLQALDIVNPRDLSWRSLFEPEDEDWRKPLIMANLMIEVPEAKGALQLLYRPGWDRDTQMGTTLDFFGGRWAPQGQPPSSKGINTLAFLPINYHHPEGNTDDASYGGRWTGVFGEANISYSLAYYHTLSDNPVLNVSVPALFPGDTGITPYKGSIGTNSLGGPILAEFILPQVDIVGGSLNAYAAPLDIVLRSELAVTLDKPYNATSGSATGLPTIKEKTTYKFMVGFDKQLRLMDLLGTDSASFWTVQLFDSWVPGFDESDKLLDLPTSHLKEHSVIAVTSLALSYNNNSIQPGVVLAVDTSYGGGVLLPNVNFLYGDHWRLRLDMPLFFKAQDGCSTDPAVGAAPDTCTHLFGTFDNNSQFSARLTYQF